MTTKSSSTDTSSTDSVAPPLAPTAPLAQALEPAPAAAPGAAARPLAAHHVHHPGASAPSVSHALAPSPESCEVKHSHPDLVTQVRPALVSLRAAEALAATFSILGDPTRVRLLDALAAEELCVCDLAELVGMSESAVSHQLRLLRSLRLVRSRRAGRMVFYTLDDNHIRLLLEQGRRHIEEDTDLGLDDEA